MRNKSNLKQIGFFSVLSYLFLVVGLLAGTYLSQVKTSSFTMAKKPLPVECQFGQAVVVENVEYPPSANQILINRGSNILDGDFTIEFLFKQLSRRDFVNPTLFSIYQRLSLFIESGSTGQQNRLKAMVSSDEVGTPQVLAGPEISLGEWHHVALTFQKTGENLGTLGLHVDGQTLVKQEMPFADNQTIISMGATYYHGLFDELRIAEKVIYSQDKPDYKVPAWPFKPNAFTLLLAHFDGDLSDSSGNGNYLQPNGVISFEENYYQCPLTPTPTPTSTPTPTLVPTPTSFPHKRVFLTSATYSGNLGGLLGADDKCQLHADTQNLGGTWKAWLSSSNLSALERLNHHNGPYVRLDGVVLANNWEDLTDGRLQNYFNVMETGDVYNSQVWTNTTSAGLPITTSTSSTCNNWTSALSYHYGYQGISYALDERWTNIGQTYPCYGRFRLYCIEQ